MSNPVDQAQIARDAATTLVSASRNRQILATLDERVISSGVAKLLYDHEKGVCSVEIDGKDVGMPAPNQTVGLAIRQGLPLLARVAAAAGLGALSASLAAATPSTPFLLAVHVLDDWKVRLRYDDLRNIPDAPPEVDADAGPAGYALHVRPSSGIEDCQPKWFSVDPQVLANAIEEGTSVLAAVLAADPETLAFLSRAVPTVERVVLGAGIGKGIKRPGRTL